MKTFKKIILIIFIILLVIIAALGIWQRDNIKSFVNFLKYSEEEISQKIDDNNKKMDDIVETTKYIDVKTGGFTPEEEKALTSGEISEEEAIKIMRGQTSLEEIKEQKQKEDSKPASKEIPDKKSEQTPTVSGKTEKPKEKDMTDEASDIVAELYVVKANFISRLEGIGQQMYNEYIATYYDPTKIMPIVDKYLPVVSQLEAECDATINSLLSKLKTALEKGGGDLSLINQIRKYYYKEKSLKKSQYMNLIYENSK